jgi:predicted permease
MMLKHPMFSLIATITLALGIGANTAIFSIFQAVLLKPLPVNQPERLIALTNDAVSFPAYKDFRDRTRAFASLAAYREREMSLFQGEKAEKISGCLVTGNYFDTLGVKTELGRAFLPDETKDSSAEFVAVISYELWQKNFGGNSDVLGKSIQLNNHPFTVIGVAPRDFRGVDLSSAPDIYVPITTWPQLATGFFTKIDMNSRSWSWLPFFGRLKDGVTIEQAQAELNLLAQQERQANARDKRPNLALQPIAVYATGFETRKDLIRFMGLLMAVVGISLIIACANVANLLLARANTRHKEIGVRLAMGATRWRIVRQLLTESILLSLIGGAAGLLIAVWTIELLSSFLLPGGIELGKLGIRLKPEILGFAFALSFITGLIFGLAPALRASKPDVVSSLKDQRANAAFSHFNLRYALIIVQVSMCLLLLIGTGLFVRSLRNAFNVNLGFNPEHIAMASVNLGLQRYDEARAAEFYKSLSERISRLPGVEAVSWVSDQPLGSGISSETVEIPDYPTQQGDDPINVNVNIVSPNFFRTLQIPLVRGRDFDERDKKETENVAIINEAMANKFWSGKEPIGRKVKIGGGEITIIGVAKDAKLISLRENPKPLLVAPLAQRMGDGGLSALTLMVRAKGNPTEILTSIERETARLDKSVSVFNIKALNENFNRRLTIQRFASALLSLFTLLAITLAVIGIYGVIAYSVSQRTHEIGIRMALGAERSHILSMFLRRGIIPILIGIAVGIAAAIALTRVISNLLFDVSATDTFTFLVSALALFFVAMFACYLPARRATKVDPMIALRHE